MSFRNHVAAMIGAAMALATACGLCECGQAQAPDNNNILYVAPTGGHSSWTRAQALNTPANHYGTITDACNKAISGDTIEVAPGTYADVPNGSLSALIAFKSNLTIRPPLPLDPNNRPKLTGGSGNNYATVRFDGSDHILFYGFEVDGSTSGPNVTGILMRPRQDANGTVIRSHDIAIKYCKVHDAGNAGIATNGGVGYLNGCDFIQITGNEIYHCLATGPDGGSGISLLVDEDITHTPGFHSTIQNNIVHDNVNMNRDLDANGNIDLKKHTDGNGIIIDTNDHGGLFNGPKTLVQNNLVYRNGGRGIHVFQSSNVTVLNNTVYGNNLDPYIQTNGPGELTAGTCNNVLFSNNVIQGNGLASAFAVGLVYGKTNGTITFKNTTYTACGSLPPVGSRDRDRTNAAIDWASTIFSDPAWGNLFVNSDNNDFHLRALATRAGLTSLQSQTALNRGSNAAGEFSPNALDGTSRTPAPGGSVDRGAYEQPGEITVTRNGYRYQRSNGHLFQAVTLTAVAGNIEGPVSLVLDNLTGASLVGATGITSAAMPSGNPYVNTLGLLSDTTRTVILEFTALPTGYTTRILVGSALR